jgi:hypothetical protein
MREFTSNGPCTGIVTLLQIGGKRIALDALGSIDPERKLAGVFFTQEMGRDIRPAQEGFIELAEAAATA